MYDWYNSYGWYNSDSPAQFSVQSPFQLVNAFDHWGGDFSGQSASDSLVMDQPKNISAYWKWDYNYIAGFVGLIASIATLLTLMPHIRRYRRKKHPKINE
jgi:hypothetical protein